MASRKHRRRFRSEVASAPYNGARQFYFSEPARRAVTRSLPYDPLSDPQRVFSLFGGPEIPPPVRSRTVRTLIRTVLGDTKRVSQRSLPERRFTLLMNRALPLGRPSLCDRRRDRREVLFATRSTGKGSRAKKHYGPQSFVRCRR